MRKRRHHNNKGYRANKNGRRSLEVEQMARRLFGARITKIADSLFIKGDKHVKPILAKSRDVKTDSGSVKTLDSGKTT